jgi:hypothetical protein
MEEAGFFLFMCFLLYKNHCSKATPDSKRKRKGPTAKSKENENDSATKPKIIKKEDATTPKIIKKEDATTPKVVKKSPVETSGQFGTEEKQHVNYTVGGSSYFFCRLWQRQCAEI